MLSITLAILVFMKLIFLGQVQMADNFRGEGKIYVVIAIFLLILAGFFYLLFKLDNKVKRLEKEIDEKEDS